VTGGIAYAEVIGDPVEHSKSPLIHHFWLERLGLTGEYKATQVTLSEIPTYLQHRRSDPSWRGCNITMPLKLAVVPLASELSEEAELLGSANLLVRDEQGQLRAENMDVIGVAEPLRRMSPATYPEDVATSVQIIGSGGAARAAARGAMLAGYRDIEVFCRDQDKGRALMAATGILAGQCHPLHALGPTHEANDQRHPHVIINATPMGMNRQPEVPVDLSRYASDTIVFDMVYAPLETGLIRQARAVGLRVIDGLDMLIGQAAPSFQALFGVPAPREHDRELRQLLIP
jgi:shikimate dehydrogenase